MAGRTALRGGAAHGAGGLVRLGGTRPRGAGPLRGAAGRVERFDRRGTEPFELFRSEFAQNPGNFVRIRQKLKKIRDA